MYTIVDMSFNDWLIQQLNERNWSQAELSRQSGLTKQAISNYVIGRTPDDTAIRKIARAFKLPLEAVYRAAGLLPSKPGGNEIIDQMVYIASQLPEDEQIGILEFVKLRQRLAEEKGHYDTQRRPAHRPATPE